MIFVCEYLASTFQQLKEHREKLARRVAKTKQFSEDVVVRGNLKKGFDTNYTKFTENAKAITIHNDFLKKRLKAFKVTIEPYTYNSQLNLNIAWKFCLNIIN